VSQLPNVALAHVEDVKVSFVRDHWQVLADALCKHPAINPVVRMVASPHGAGLFNAAGSAVLSPFRHTCDAK